VPRNPKPIVLHIDDERLRDARTLASHAPVPAQVESVLCGTAGWTDPSLIAAGTFYPPEARSPADRLAHYARHFPVVEVDATYYAIPSPLVSAGWVERAPPGFVFDIKAHPVFTGHPVDRSRLPRELAEAVRDVRPGRKRIYPKDVPAEVRASLQERFRAFLAPLVAAGRLGCVMVQLPPWTTATRGAAREIEALRASLPEVAIAIEFRHPSWLEPERQGRVLDMLRAHGFAYVVVDEPDVLGGGVPPVVAVTRPGLAVVRFHGHNAAGWRKGASVAERFDYLYSPAEIAAWVAPVRRMAGEAERVHAVFNNCVRDHAVLGAKDLAALLAAPAEGDTPGSRS
jgi:uncharacterized protein YecE (DUF72 family)